MDPIRQLAEEIESKNGRLFYVGGCVRDKLLNRPCHDFDLDVININQVTLRQILDEIFPKQWILAGKAYPIYKINNNIDIALNSYKSMNQALEISALRRDFTFNTLFQDVLTDEIIDPMNAKRDIEHKVIRLVFDDNFDKDPARVFRAARFSACLGFTMTESAKTQAERTNLKDVSKEQVFGELSKALLEAKKPSVFFETLKNIHKLHDWFPELTACIGTKQNAEYHKEGDVWVHTMLVIDEAAKVRNNAKYPLEFMLAAVCHDLGKPLCTSIDDKGIVHTYQHEYVGIEPAKKFIIKLTPDKNILNYVLNMVEMHMRPMHCINNKSNPITTTKMFDASICPKDLVLLSQSDRLGRIPSGILGKDMIPKRLELYEEITSKPNVTDEELLNNGIPQGKMLNIAKTHARKLWLHGISKNDILKQTIGYMRVVMRKEPPDEQ